MAWPVQETGFTHLYHVSTGDTGGKTLILRQGQIPVVAR
jgi:hypothetical protein